MNKEWMQYAKFFAIPVALIIAMLVYKNWPSLPQDNPVEEFIEEILQEKTGISIDISPDSKEKYGNS